MVNPILRSAPKHPRSTKPMGFLSGISISTFHWDHLRGLGWEICEWRMFGTGQGAQCCRITARGAGEKGSLSETSVGSQRLDKLSMLELSIWEVSPSRNGDFIGFKWDLMSFKWWIKGFHSRGVHQNLDGLFHGKSHRSKWMMNGGTPTLGNHHIDMFACG